MRDLYLQSDNLINYDAGPVTFYICGVSKTITLKTTLEWAHFLPIVLDVSKQAWGVTTEDIKSIKECEIIINYNLLIVSEYIENAIIFI